MPLFDSIPRDFKGPRPYSEPQFIFLNRSAWPESERIRDLLEKWFVLYPRKEQEELRSRFRSDNNKQHYSANYELFLHALLLELGYEVEIHPDVSDVEEKHPDFIAKSKKGNKFYIEAVLVTDESDEEAAAKARQNIVYDSINRLNSPNFFIGMKLKGFPNTPPKGRKIRKFLSSNLSGLNPDNLAKILEASGFDALPHWEYNHDGWIIDFFPIPKSPSKRGKPDVRPIGFQMPEGKILDSRTAIRDAILKKGGRYGKLDLPYVIAVNILTEYGIDKVDIEEALLGKENYAFDKDSCKMIGRIPDGAWFDKSGPRYTRVSAVLLTYPLAMWNFPKAPVRLFHNPCAKLEYTSELTCLPQVIRNHDHLKWVDGKSIGEIFKLPANWPFENT